MDPWLRYGPEQIVTITLWIVYNNRKKKCLQLMKPCVYLLEALPFKQKSVDYYFPRLRLVHASFTLSWKHLKRQTANFWSHFLWKLDWYSDSRNFIPSSRTSLPVKTKDVHTSIKWFESRPQVIWIYVQPGLLSSLFFRLNAADPTLEICRSTTMIGEMS